MERLHMKFEEPTSNTNSSGKTTNDKTLYKNYNITHFEISLPLKMSYVPILNALIKLTLPQYYVISCL